MEGAEDNISQIGGGGQEAIGDIKPAAVLADGPILMPTAVDQRQDTTTKPAVQVGGYDAISIGGGGVEASISAPAANKSTRKPTVPAALKESGKQGGGLPACLQCPVCGELLKSAVLLPCCSTCLCRPCAFKKLAMNKKKCWLNKTEKCNDFIKLDKILPAQKYRELVQDFSNGGDKYKLIDQTNIEGEEEEEIEYLDNATVHQAHLTHKPMVAIKTEQPQQAMEEEEYFECAENTAANSIKAEPGSLQSDANSSILTPEALTTYLNSSSIPSVIPDAAKMIPKLEPQDQLEPAMVTTLKRESIDSMDNISQDDRLGYPQSTTTVDELQANTPSSARTDHQSSGYWSDDNYEGTFFGKLTWDPSEPSWGKIQCWDNGEMKIAHVRRLEVKCGAETGDLVEFTLSTDSENRKVAKRVKLVEKALPTSEEDQIKSQDNLKRSVEMSSGIILPEFNKKLKTDDDIIEPSVYQDSVGTMEYSDIVDDLTDNKYTNENQHQPFPTDIKSEFLNLLAVQDEPSQDCNCSSTELKRCGLCPLYFIRSESQNTILEGECMTFLARIDGLDPHQYQEGDVKFVKQLPFPFLANPGTIDFKMLAILGPNCLVKKISPVFSDSYVFVSMVNESEGQVNISPDTVLGICQVSNVQANEVSTHYILEPPDRQSDDEIPVTVKRADFSRYDQNHVCGFAEIGSADTRYNYSLVKITLSPEYRSKFTLNKSEMTVQVKRNVWLELVPKFTGGYVKLLPPKGIIGYARPVTHQEYVSELLNPSSQVYDEDDSSARARLKDEADHYESMMNKLNSITATIPEDDKVKTNLMDKDFRGVTNEVVTILAESERTVNLFLTSEDGEEAKSLLKLKVQVTTNDEFQYYNNCYTIESQITTVIKSRCQLDNSYKPAVKVIIRNIRQDVAQIPANSPVAIVKITTADQQQTSAVGKTQKSSSQKLSGVNLGGNHGKKLDPVKLLEKFCKRARKQWDRLLAERTFEKSLRVEERYPYFSLPVKPKIPFGMTKMTELLMRVGINQDAKPMRVIEKQDRLHTCTICDILIMDRYALQDHVYSENHKRKLKNHQVIAGLQERLYLGRPVIQEYLDHLDDELLNRMLGLDSIFEVLNGANKPVYHCALCGKDFTDVHLPSHVLSTGHVLNFFKKNFPSAWARFSTLEKPANWSDLDYEAYESIVVKIGEICGVRKANIVKSYDKLEEIIDRHTSGQFYMSKHEAVDQLVRSLPSSDLSSGTAITNQPPSRTLVQRRTMARIAVNLQDIILPPGGQERVECKIVNVPQPRTLLEKFVYVTSCPKLSLCAVNQGFSRVYLGGSSAAGGSVEGDGPGLQHEQQACLTLGVHNSSPNMPVTIPAGTDLALVKWKKSQ